MKPLPELNDVMQQMRAEAHKRLQGLVPKFALYLRFLHRLRDGNATRPL